MTQPTERHIYNSEIRQENQIARENNAASSGLTLGILLALVGLGVGTFFLMNQRTDIQPPNQTTIIERTKEAVPQPQAPDVNITVPSPEPVKMPDVNINAPNPAPQNNAPASQPTPAKP